MRHACASPRLLSGQQQKPTSRRALATAAPFLDTRPHVASTICYQQLAALGCPSPKSIRLVQADADSINLSLVSMPLWPPASFISRGVDRTYHQAGHFSSTCGVRLATPAHSHIAMPMKSSLWSGRDPRPTPRVSRTDDAGHPPQQSRPLLPSPSSELPSPPAHP